MATDRYSLRENNEQLVLTTLIEQPAISRAQISKRLGLNKATVSDIANKLIDNQFILEIGNGDSTTSGGRKPILLQINKQAGLTLTIDLGYDYLSYLVTYLNGEVVEKVTVPILINQSNCVELIQQTLLKVTHLAEDVPYGIVHLAIAVHGIVNNNRIIFTPYYDLDQMDLHEQLTEHINIPISIENEANLSVLAERTFSTMVSNLVSISVHSGVGAGIIVNGELYHGRDGRSGEIGHTILYPHGKDCPCGNKGCLEQYCSQKAVLSSLQQLKSNSTLTLEDLVAFYQAGDKESLHLIEQFATYISIGINNAIASYGPEKIFLNSTLIQEIPELLPMIKENMKSSFSLETPIERSILAEKAILLGGAALSIQHFFHLSTLPLISREDPLVDRPV